MELRTSAPVLRQRKQASLAHAHAAFDFDRLVRAPGSPLDAVCEMAARVARYDLSVLVASESGAGKELLARAIHYASPRCERAFAMENCAPMVAPFFSMRLVIRRPHFKSNCCACCKWARLVRWVPAA
jgi:two-component system response regulator HupR/HoxA